MEKKEIKNPSVFSAIHDDYYEPGIDLRDYLASKAMQGFLSNNGINNGQKGINDLIIASYQLADATLEYRLKNPLQLPESTLEKAKKWEALEKKIGDIYFDEFGNEKEGDDMDLSDIGEVAATSLGFM